MCWNVENLVLPPADDTAARDRVQHKQANLAGVIGGQQPDLLAPQEIGTFRNKSEHMPIC